MRKCLGTLILLLACVSLCHADITFEGDKQVSLYEIASVRAKGDYKSFIYRVFGPDGKRVKTKRGEGGWVLFTGPAGKYRVEAIAGKTDKDGNLTLDEGECEVSVGGGPGPGPAPDPDPPEPEPGPKEPDDPLYAALKDAYKADTGKSKAGYMLQLSSLYRVVGKNLDKWKKAGEMDEDIKAARKQLGIGDADLVGVRKVIGGELARFMPPAAEDELTPDHKVRAKVLFENLEKYLEIIAKVDAKEKWRKR